MRWPTAVTTKRVLADVSGGEAWVFGGVQLPAPRSDEGKRREEHKVRAAYLANGGQRRAPACALERPWPLLASRHMKAERGALVGHENISLTESSEEHERIKFQIPQHITCCYGGIATTTRL